MVLIPISEVSPCGIDTKYDDTFLLTEAEIDKANSLAEGHATNWRLVSESSQTLLLQTTKDIKLASWWAYAQFRLNGFEGLEIALDTLNGLLDTFGEELFPKSNRVKFNALQWFETMLIPNVIHERRLVIPSDKIELFLDLFQTFQLLVKKVSSIDPLLFKEVCRLLEEEKKLRDENQQKKAEIITPNENTTNASEISNDADAIKILNQIKKNSEMLSRYWRTKHADDLRAIRMTRMISWLEIDGLPAIQNGKTPLNPPSLERVEEIDALIAAEKIDEAIEMIETVLLRSPFWIEGHFKVYKIFETAKQSKAANEIKNMLIAFIKSNEGISELNFRDGTPFVSSELKEWLYEEMEMGEINAVDGGEKENVKYENIKESCYALLKKKDAKGAMEVLQRSYRNAAYKEEQFQWRLLHAQIAVEALKPQMAIALIDELEKDIAHFRLEEWQPDLAAQVYRLILNSFNRTQLDHERLQSAYQGLCRVNTAEAIDIKF